MIEVLNVLPEALAGYGIGQASEQLAIRHIKENQLGWIKEHGESSTKPNVRQGWLRRSIAVLAMTGALAGGLVGEAFQTHETHVSNQPYLAEGLDLTFGTGPLGDNSATKIKPVAEQVADPSDIRVEAVAAHNNTVSPIKISGLNALYPDGGQNMPDAVTAAINNAYNNASTTTGNSFKGAEKDGAVLVVTDDDAIGNPSTVASYAKQNGNMPVYVANVGPNNDQTAQDLQMVAKLTGGKYFHAGKNVPAATIASDIKQDMEPHAVGVQEKPDPAPWLEFALGTTLLGGLIYKGRRRQASPKYMAQ